MDRKCFTIQSSKGSKYKIVVTYKNGNPEIYIGGSKYYCIKCILDVKSGDTCHDLHIRNVNFTHKATDMMKALLYFMRVKKQDIGYEGPCNITFTDTSENQFCGNLSSYYLAFYKKTWYEKDFDAYLINGKLTPREKHNLNLPEKYLKNDVFDAVNMYKDYVKRLDDPEYHTEKLKNAIETYINILNPTIIENVLQIYDETSTIYEFFNKIKKTFGNIKALNLPLWLDKFIKLTLGFKFLKNQNWRIDCDRILDNSSSYEIKSCDGKNMPKNYLAVNQTGNGEKKKLTLRQRESYTSPNWIGWVNMNINEYTRKDRIFLKNLRKPTLPTTVIDASR